MITGHFVNFYLPFLDENGHLISAKDQAFLIISEAQKRISTGSPGVAITYSANYGQSLKIRQVYNEGGWDTQTNGSNQAKVMHEMENFMKTSYPELQRHIHIAPITTMEGDTSYGEKSHKEVVQLDLEYIKLLLDDNWDVLGWINIDKKPAHYAIGGGVVKNLPQDINKLIQATLTQYSKDFPEF